MTWRSGWQRIRGLLPSSRLLEDDEEVAGEVGSYHDIERESLVKTPVYALE